MNSPNQAVNKVLISLPPVRKKVFRHSLLIVGLYVVVGIFMMIAVFLASGLTPKAIHLNYDSIAAASQMEHAWDAIRNPSQHPQKSVAQWMEEFEKAISFEESNISEPGEAAVSTKIRRIWEDTKKHPDKIEQPVSEKMKSDLATLVDINEQGMFRWVERSNRFSQHVFIATVIIFIVTLIIALFLADGLAVRIATPLRELSAALRKKPEPGSKLKLPEPTTLEIRILSHELSQLWQRVSELQKLNLEEISSHRKMLETVLASVDDGILVLDNEENIIHCNDGMLNLLGSDFALSDVIGQPWRDLSTLSRNYLKLREVLRPEISGDQPVPLELKGTDRIFSARCRPILDERNIQTGSLYLLHDITEIKQKDRLKSEFIGVLSHELKTPLQSLGTASELLLKRKDLLDEEGQMLLETIHQDVGRIRGVANEFVQVGLIDLHSLRLRMEPVVINALIQQWIQPFQVLAKDRGVKIEFIKEGSESITARIDTVKFPWAITNLLSNAIRVSPPNSTVTVHISDRERRVDIEVRDEGPGIPEAVQQKMFDPFFQGGSVTGGKTSGFLGLGLTITREVVEAHDGLIEYFPRKPQGSIFRISLPLIM
ncbi:MAG: ATP-binding protein [Oligoflexia bacterium]|nr:ATP-binding protein [Oligoflexia bacterium]